VTKIDHIGSAHDDQELALLLDEAARKMHDGQLSFELAPDLLGAKIVSTASSYLWSQLELVWSQLGFDVIRDEVFKQVVLARIIEPVSKLDSVRVLGELGLKAPSDDAIYRSLQRCQKRNYREKFSKACFSSNAQTNGMSLLLYDVTTLYFEIQKEDEFRKPGYSKERRLEPQIIVGLLVDESGFPLMVHSFEGNKAETLTILPVIKAFAKLNGLSNPVIVADAAMLSAANLLELEEQGFTFIVGSRINKTPHGVSEYKRDNPSDEIKDGQIFEESIVMGKGESQKQRRVIYQYRAKRAALDLSNIEKQISKANKVLENKLPVTRTRFVNLEGTTKTLNEDLIADTKAKAGIKGYVTNIETAQASQIIGHYHKLFEVERSFRMSKHDLKARPIFHHKRDSIEAHLTVVFGALAISRHIQARTNLSIRRYLQMLRPLKGAVIRFGGKTIELPPEIPPNILSLEGGH
jgi:hypothetical protein